jgi:hypothetical protein
MLDELGLPTVSEAAGKTPKQPGTLGYFPQQQQAAARTEPTAIESGDHLASATALEFKWACFTLCLHRLAPSAV